MDEGGRFWGDVFFSTLFFLIMFVGIFLFDKVMGVRSDDKSHGRMARIKKRGGIG